MSLDTKALGQKIRAIRKSKGLTQQALSELIDCSPTYISYIESGHKSMSLETLVGIANAMDVSTDLLLQDSLITRRSSSTSISSDMMADCSSAERRILTDILLACKQALRRNRRLK